MLVLRFDGPAATTIGSAGLAALRLGTEPLMPAVPNIGIEQLPAMHALTLIGLGNPVRGMALTQCPKLSCPAAYVEEDEALFRIELGD